MEDIVQLKDQIYVLATSSLADGRTRVLKQGEAFVVFDAMGNVQPIGQSTQGLFYGSTRYLSYLEMRLDGVRPLLLCSAVGHNNALLTVDLMNREVHDQKDNAILPASVHIYRSKFLWERACYERLEVTNFGTNPVDISLSLSFGADFADIFELRGMKRTKKGTIQEPEIKSNEVRLSYQGLDQIVRRTTLNFWPEPSRLTGNVAEFRETLTPKRTRTYFITVMCEAQDPYRENYAPKIHGPYSTAFSEMSESMGEARTKDVTVGCSHEPFNEWWRRSQSDLHMMLTKTLYGPYPYAGVPLFNTIFGRDGLITAYQALWVNPEIARGVLSYLAATQATESLPEQDAEPGKILHEVRSGEMVNLGEVPFKNYYGSADSTPLFLIVAAAYFERTGDRGFISSIWPQIELALHWIDRFGDLDGDGFVEYSRKSPKGLINQGWKDSWDSVFHQDGRLAEGPIALCEIQAYVYKAKRMIAEVAAQFGEIQRAEKLNEEAETLRRKFEEKFWSEELGTYVIALDGNKEPCKVRSSNAGHCLFGGIASPERAKRVTEMLMSEALFSGWGIRTIGTEEARYNPMSYHNGSVWPHDNSLIAEGFVNYGFADSAQKILSSLCEASLYMDLVRLPELFCGFSRRTAEGPTLYPVACSPQAWASATIFLLLKSVLGLSLRVGSSQGKMRFCHPSLPKELDQLTIKNLRVGLGSADILLRRHEEDIGINILRREGALEIVAVK